MAIGGNEDKTSDKAVLRSVLELVRGGSRHVEVIPTASTLPKEVADDYIKAFKDLGVRKVGILDIRSREDADREDYAQRVHDCDVVYITGGDQVRLTSLLGGSKVGQAMRDTYFDGGVVAGTSAGAAAMSTTMIAGGDHEQAMRKRSVAMTPGLGLVKDCVIDTHFLDRGRVSRLLEVVATNPGTIGLGVGEDTGILVRDGHRVEVLGSGIVVVVDGKEIRTSNVPDAGPHEPLAVERLILHTLVAGYGFDLAEHVYSAPPAKKKTAEEKRAEAKAGEAGR
ncbi:MAG: cyanophycinase [Thermoplasmata archaeon]|nr:cyanophycinase [Thermoplasmata archaeon]